MAAVAKDVEKVHETYQKQTSGRVWTPVLVVLFWLLAAPKHGLRFRTALAWMLWPLAYVGYALLRGQLEGIYPYFFVDPTEIGWIGVARWSGILCVGFVTAGSMQVGVARLLR